MVSTLVDLVYYYPPNSSTNGNTLFGIPQATTVYATFDPRNIVSVQLNDIGIVSVQYKLGINAGIEVGLQNLVTNPTAEFSSLTSGTTLVNVDMTPEAFTNWYHNNIQTIQQSSQSTQLTAMNAQITSTNQEQNTANLISSKGWQWETFEQWMSSVPTGYVLPIRYTYQKDNPQNLYALVDPTGQYGTTVTNQTSPNINPNSTNPIQIPGWVYLTVAGIGILLILILISRSTSGRPIYPRGVTTTVSKVGGAAKRIETESRGRTEKEIVPSQTRSILREDSQMRKESDVVEV